METNVILSFLGALVLLTLIPGPDNIFVLTESLTKGSKNGIAISFGLVSGILIHTLAAATGLSLIIQNECIESESFPVFHCLLTPVYTKWWLKVIPG